MGSGIFLYVVFGGPKRRDVLPFQHMVFIDVLDLDIRPTDGRTRGRFLWLRPRKRAHNFCPKSSARSESHGLARSSGKCSLAVCPGKKAKQFCAQLTSLCHRGQSLLPSMAGSDARVLKSDDKLYLYLRESAYFEEASGRDMENFI